MRVALSLAMLGSGLALFGASVGLADARGPQAAEIRQGGTFRLTYVPVAFDYVDPALAFAPGSWEVLDVVCTRLMNQPDKAGLRLVPEAAVGPPVISPDGRTYTFTVRRGLRFSNGDPILASAFKYAITRIRKLGPGPDPNNELPGWFFTKDIARVTASGRVVTFRLKRPAPDFQIRTSMAFFCAVHPQLPVDREGLRRFEASGPYTITEYVPGRGVVLGRNRLYRGERPQRVSTIRVDIEPSSAAQIIDRVERNLYDWSAVPGFFYDASDYRRLAGKYGVNRGRFWIAPGLAFRGYALNTSRPLFRSAAVRKAINFAVNRAAVRRAFGTPWNGSTLSDQYLPPGFPGFKPVSIYPLRRSNLARARRLIRGYRGNRHAVLYSPADEASIAAAQVVARALGQLGLSVDIRTFTSGDVYNRHVHEDASWDIALQRWFPDIRDPSNYLNAFFQAGSLNNVSHFDSKPFNRRLRLAARLPVGPARFRAYGQLDVDLARMAAPWVAIDYLNDPTLVSNRVDPRCIVLRPTLDLAAVCLKPGA